RFPSVLRLRLYQILSALIFAGAIRPFGFLAVPTLSDPFSFPVRFLAKRYRFEFGSDFLSERVRLSAWSLL
ncbi:hypothetical protein, partial [Streptomyces sp. NPDC057579]|uniref:hypothetical protein n=1 Tax=Streptomyces sp. NPDC057579 TaxID=3346172 RepID=UPI0036C6F8DF